MGSVNNTDPLGILDRAVEAVCGAELDGLDEPALTARLDSIQLVQGRLAAERARLTAVLETRRTRDTDDVRQQDRLRQQLRRDLGNRSNQPPGQTKLDAQAGAAARAHSETGRAFAAGRIRAEHVRLIAETLEALPEGPDRDQLELDLLDRALTTPPVPFGRYTREMLARRAPISISLREERQHRERRVHAVDTPDGGLSLSGIVYGTAAETIRTALDAFRRPDVSGELRTPGQRTADAFEQLCATALRAGQAPAQHGTRPHVLITVTTDQLDRGDDGLARLGSGEHTSLARLRHLLDDCDWSRVVLAPDSTPIEASIRVRTVPNGLWRALLARDRGCTWARCDAPAAWCDVAHGATPFAADGQLSPDNAALLCRRHHRRFDHGDYRISIDGDRVTYRRVPDEQVGDAPPSWGRDRGQRPSPLPRGSTARLRRRAPRAARSTAAGQAAAGQAAAGQAALPGCHGAAADP